MAERIPSIPSVRVRAAGASHAGPRRPHNEDAFAIFEDATSALAVVVDGMGGNSTGDEAARRVVETCGNLFRGRATTILDDLAETWWQSEHGETGRRVRPFSTLPIVERVELRDRVRRLLEQRVPETLGDAAVLEAETTLLLGIGERALHRANADIHRLVEKERPRWQGLGACAATVTFAAGRAAIAHVGDCRVSRVRGGSIEALTTDHTLHNDAAHLPLEQQPTPEELEAIPHEVLTRLLGAKDRVEVATISVPLEPGDLFVLASDGLSLAFSEMELLTTVRSRRAAAADYLIERGKRDRPNHPGDNLTAVVVEIA